MKKQYEAPAMTEVLDSQDPLIIHRCGIESAVGSPTPEFVSAYNLFCDELQNEWKPFDGDYEKCFYDIRLKDGREWKDCWPNAGMFASTITGAHVKYEYVVSVKKLETNEAMERTLERMEPERKKALVMALERLGPPKRLGPQRKDGGR